MLDFRHTISVVRATAKDLSAIARVPFVHSAAHDMFLLQKVRSIQSALDIADGKVESASVNLTSKRVEQRSSVSLRPL